MMTKRLTLCLGLVAIALASIGTVAGAAERNVPDTTPVMVQVNTIAPSLSPEEVEQQITFPIEQVISGLPDLEKLRSISKFGMSQVVVTFEDGTDIYFARQLIGERLATVELPVGIERPKMGPVSTGLGEVFHYVVRAEGVDMATLTKSQRIEKLTELRTIHDWVIRPQMRTVAGSAEVNSWGGYEKQYQVRIEVMKFFTANVLTIGLFAIAALTITGCGDKPKEKDAESDKKANASNDDGHDLEGWWCNEHGVPEEECSMCSAKAAADFKAKGDWCEEHNRAESQCFKCDPSRAEKFAKLYEAKAGHAPPKPAE